MQGSLIDRIYEAAAVPELWEAVLQRAAETAGSFGGLLFVLSDAETRWVASPGALSLWEGFIAEGWLENNSRAKRLLDYNHAGWVHDLDLFTLDELEVEPVYRDYFRKIGAGWGAGTAMELPNGDSIFFTMERAYEAGPFLRSQIDHLDTLRPHLGRAAYLSLRLAMSNAQATTAALGAVGTAAAVVRPNGRLLAANAEFQVMIPQVFVDRKERLKLADNSADRLLVAALAQLSRGEGVANVASIPIQGMHPQDHGLVIHILPVRRAANDIFPGASFIIIANKIGPTVSPRASLLSALFDLTPTEARIARAISEAKTINAIAAENGVSRETVRAQMRSIFSKTGLHSQAALVRLVLSVAGGPLGSHES